MGERSHTTSPAHAPNGKRVRAVLAVGTAAVLIGGGIVYLLMQPDSASAKSKPRRTDRTTTNPRNTKQPRRANPAAAQKTQFVARVNNDRISWQELADLCVKRYGEEVLDNLVNKRVIEQACRDKGIRVTSGEIDAEIEKQAKMFRVTSKQWLKMLEDDRDLKPEQYAKDIVWPKLALTKLTKDRLEVTAEDLQKGFEANYGPRVRARMIVMGDQRKLTQIWAQVKANPKDFGRLARDHSEDPGSRALDGQIQPIAMHSGFDTFWKTAFELKEGELSGVIQIGDRHAILLCEGRTEPLDVTMENVRAILHDEILERKTQAEINKVFQELKDRAKIETYLNPSGRAAATPGAATGQTAALVTGSTANTAKRATRTRTK